MRTQLLRLLGVLCAVVLTASGVAQEIQPDGEPASNSEPNYRALRDAQLGDSFTVSGLTLRRDVGTFDFQSGTIRFLQSVLGRTVMAVFEGSGRFTLTPAIPGERDHLLRMLGKDTAVEEFDRLVLCFTDRTFEEIQSQAQPSPAAGGENVLRDFQKRLRRNTEEPRSFLDGLLSGEDVENVEAELLAGLYDPSQEGIFSAYIFGRKHSDLRFHIRPRGGLPQLSSPEEVGLLNVDPQGSEEGIWYLAHRSEEYDSGEASSQEYEWPIDVTHYRIETTIRNEKIDATAEITFTGTEDGPRVLRFGLLPSLRVSAVSSSESPVAFIQERRQEDSAFYVVMPEPLAMGQEYHVTVSYQGEKVLEDRGGGNFVVGARSSWYPSVNSFADRATYDLIFRVEDKYVLVSVGKLQSQERKDKMEITRWASEVPLAVAGFNFGRFQKKVVHDEPTNYEVEGYMVRELPDSSQADFVERFGHKLSINVTTTGMNKVMVEAQNSVRLFSVWFGESPYARIAVTQQPQAAFSQSWLSLIFLSFQSFLDAGNSRNMGETPHEVAHQWWGHMVGWASYRGQWLSEGFSDFSASLYLQAIEKNPVRFQEFWETSRKSIVEKNRFGMRANDAGPISMGLRLRSAKTPGAYSQLVYSKGAFVLHMLRQMMFDPQTGDQRFIAMMKEFVAAHLHQNASTESFQRIVEGHMQPAWDLDGNGSMDWFFRQWVHGTELPSYRLEYKFTPQGDGKVLLTGSMTQSGVSEDFKMPVPIYLEFDNGIAGLGQAILVGDTTSPGLEVMLPRMPKRVLVNAYQDVLAAENISQQVK